MAGTDQSPGAQEALVDKERWLQRLRGPDGRTARPNSVQVAPPVSTQSQPGPPMRKMRVETNHATSAAATAAAATAAVLYNVES